METAVLIGGESMLRQIIGLGRNPRIIVATPGRLIDHMQEHRVRLDDVHVLVLDEADRMLDMGFAPQIEQILSAHPERTADHAFLGDHAARDREYRLFPHEAAGAHRDRARRDGGGRTSPRKFSSSKRKTRARCWTRSLNSIPARSCCSPGPNAARTKSPSSCGRRPPRGGDTCRPLAQPAKRSAGRVSRSGKYRILVATDIAARGIDVTGIELVINYDLPDDPENYVHRIGRTGRAGHEGHAISLATPDQKSDVQTIERLIKKTIPLSTHPEMPREHLATGAPSSAGNRAGRNIPANRGPGGHHHGGHRLTTLASRAVPFPR